MARSLSGLRKLTKKGNNNPFDSPALKKRCFGGKTGETFINLNDLSEETKKRLGVEDDSKKVTVNSMMKALIEEKISKSKNPGMKKALKKIRKEYK